MVYVFLQVVCADILKLQAPADDDSPIPAPQQTARKQPGKRVFACLKDGGTERELLSPCRHNTGAGAILKPDLNSSTETL